MLTGTSSDTRTSLNYSVYLTFSFTRTDAVIIFLYETVSCLISKRRDSSCSERLSVAKDNLRVLMSLGLILTREVKVDIRLFISLKSKECLKRDIKSVLVQKSSALRASLIRHVTSRITTVFKDFFRIKIAVFALRTHIVRTKRINFRNSRSKGNERRSYRSTRSNEISVLV